MRLLTRICYNSERWKKPSGDAGSLEGKDSFVTQFGFGFEEWLCRDEWQIGGWRYAFLQGANDPGAAYYRQPLDIVLFAIRPDDSRQIVATISELEVLKLPQSREAENEFRSRGWIEAMERDIQAQNGQVPALLDRRHTQTFLNVRFRFSNLNLMHEDVVLAPDPWLEDRHRYMFYKLDDENLTEFARSLASQPGRRIPFDPVSILRRGVGPIEYTPEHRIMQANLLAKLQGRYGGKAVRIEVNGIDAVVETETEIRLYEIKTDINPLTVVRQALGQILEYAYHPSRQHGKDVKLIIVGRNALTGDDLLFLNRLRDTFKLPVQYIVIPL